MRTLSRTVAGSAALALGLAGAVATAPGAVATAPGAAADGCSPAGTTGMNAKVVVSSGGTVTGEVDATGCDIGVYVGPGAAGAVVDGVTVHGANDHGILVQDVDDVVIRNSTVTGNGVARHSGQSGSALSEDKALTLLGTRGVLVQNNMIVNNVGDGGVSINDDGPGASQAVIYGGLLRAADNNVLRGNDVGGNLGGCGIVLSAFHPGMGVDHNLVIGNTVHGARYSGVVGSLVVAADEPHTAAIGNVVLWNTVTYSLIPGIIVHSNAPGDLVAGTRILHNTLVSDNWVPGADSAPGKRVGIAIASESASAPSPSVITRTMVAQNSITDEDYGIWISHADHTKLVHNHFSDVVTPVESDS